MPAKKAAKKAPHKAAKKAAKKSAHHHHPSRDLRRAYEHLGRIEILEGALVGSPLSDVSALANLAQQQLAGGDDRAAADLLRAAEHLSFAALAPRSSHADRAHLSPSLKAAITAEFDHLLRHAGHPQVDSVPGKKIGSTSGTSSLAALCERILDEAQKKFAASAYRPALELARAAEALSHISANGPLELPAGNTLIHRLAS